ncbi:MAG: hypothetical protein KAU21_10340, partial [Gammaproteobacteria bacterium]|nr:hypothetical protein [Gammaproteobacteria bacterium]
SATDSENIHVKDTTKPVITAKLLDTRTGETVTEVESGNPVEILMKATDICDPNPVISGTGGFTVEPDDRFTAIKRHNGETAETTVSTQTDNISFSIIAKDSSGNTSTENLSLDVKAKGSSL